MTTQVREVADELVELCRQGKNLEAVDRFHSPDIVSTEAAEMGGMPRVVRGQAGVRAKNEAWVKDTKVHSSELRGLLSRLPLRIAKVCRHCNDGLRHRLAKAQFCGLLHLA